MNEKTRPLGSTTDLPLIEISRALQRQAVLQNPESSSAIEEETPIEETPALVFREQEYQEEDHIQWKRIP
jgi:hypothetical protein